MLDLNNDFVLSACIGFIAVVISYIYNKDNKGNKEQSKNSNNYYFYVFLVVSLLVYGGLYFKNIIKLVLFVYLISFNITTF